MKPDKTTSETTGTERIEQLRLDTIAEQIQMRVSMSADVIADYAELQRRKDGGGLPPVQAIRARDGSVYVWDGNHTIAAARENGRTDVAATIVDGTRDQAVLLAAGANRQHGLRRTHADLRHTVETLLSNAKWAGRSDRWLAEKVGCSNTFVGTVRREAALSTVDSEREGRDGRRIKTKHIGRRKAATPRVANDPSPATVPSPQRATSPAADQEPPLCPVCEVRNAVDGQRCQVCIDEGKTGDEEDALQAQAGVARPDPELQAGGGKRRRKDAETGIELKDYVYRMSGTIAGMLENLQAVPPDAWQLFSGEEWPRLERLSGAAADLAGFLHDLPKPHRVDTIDVKLFELGVINQHGELRNGTKGKLLKAARLIVQRLEAETMRPDVQHCARLLGMALDGFERLQTR